MTIGVLTRPVRFLEIHEILTLHEMATDEYGGSQGMRDRGMLESAAGTARQTADGSLVHDMPFGIAAAYAYHISQNHPFIDGNKRTALAAMVTFLELNGWLLRVPDLDAAGRILSIAQGKLSKPQLAEWLASVCKPKPSIELRDFFRDLDYARLGSVFSSIAAGAVEERVRTTMEAGEFIPAIHQANIGAVHAEAAGEMGSADLLRQHAVLLTALYRIAEDYGYEW